MLIMDSVIHLKMDQRSHSAAVHDNDFNSSATFYWIVLYEKK